MNHLSLEAIITSLQCLDLQTKLHLSIRHFRGRSEVEIIFFSNFNIRFANHLLVKNMSFTPWLF